MVGCSSGIPKPKNHPLDVDRTILPGVIRRQQGLAATTWFHFWLSAGTGEWMARMLQAAGDALTVSTCFGPTPTRHPASLTKCPTRYGSGSAGGVDFIRSGVPQVVRKQAAIRHEQLLRARLGQRSVEVLGGTILSTFTSGSKAAGRMLAPSQLGCPHQPGPDVHKLLEWCSRCTGESKGPKHLAGSVDPPASTSGRSGREGAGPGGAPLPTRLQAHETWHTRVRLSTLGRSITLENTDLQVRQPTYVRRLSQACQEEKPQ